ncbi:hypothetical protein CEXT_151141 [Caerostris extrusa]|uniref:Uncharacterized protein n=1 Tax=Caerostris extrusa TaxID=172846 RepID=A0AAV4RTK6_CAEEX|nr:hypothetical protein CEXT_151141 [Caerostris extrusa]
MPSVSFCKKNLLDPLPPAKGSTRHSMLIPGAGFPARPGIILGIIQDPALNDGLKPCGGPHRTTYPVRVQLEDHIH